MNSARTRTLDLMERAEQMSDNEWSLVGRRYGLLVCDDNSADQVRKVVTSRPKIHARMKELRVESGRWWDEHRPEISKVSDEYQAFSMAALAVGLAPHLHERLVSQMTTPIFSVIGAGEISTSKRRGLSALWHRVRKP